MTTYSLPVENKQDSQSFYQEKIRNTIPSYIYDNSPKFIAFLQAYFDYLFEEGNIGSKLLSLRGSRDSSLSAFQENLVNEYAKFLSQNTTLPKDTLLKIISIFLKSKGTEESIEAFFRLFYNDDTVQVVYPKDNMLYTDGGNWNDDDSIFINNQGFSDETTMVLQDDYYYQIYSYVIKSGLSTDKWSEVFNVLVHPLGWIFFGEIEILSFAAFRVGLLSPLFVPGSQESDIPALQISTNASHNELAKFQIFERIIWREAEFTFDTIDLGLNILNSSRLTLSDLSSFTFDQLNSNPINTTIRKGSQVDLS